ncbi:MAG: hypothetical protein ACXIUZ_03805 [Lysobacteraceae bacterium]
MSTDSNRSFPILPVVIVVAAIVLFAVGWWRGGAAPKAQVQQLTAELESSRESAADAGRERDQARALVTLREAQVAVLQANMELDRRNFGTASDHVQRAARLVGEVDAAQLSIDASRLARLQADLEGTDLSLATDLSQQRDQLMRLTGEINAIAAAR